jgi:hypothetical protein
LELYISGRQKNKLYSEFIQRIFIFYGRVMMSEVEEARHEQTMPNEEEQSQ